MYLYSASNYKTYKNFKNVHLVVENVKLSMGLLFRCSGKSISNSDTKLNHRKQFPAANTLAVLDVRINYLLYQNVEQYRYFSRILSLELPVSNIIMFGKIERFQNT